MDLDDHRFGVVRGVQGIKGDHGSPYRDVFEQRLGGREFAALIVAAAAGERMAIMGHPGHGFEVNTPVGVSVDATQPLAVGGEDR